MQSFGELSLLQEFQQVGYKEFCDMSHGFSDFDSLYASFDECIQFLQTNKSWQHTLYHAKERFIRTKNKDYYGTDFFGFYDESQHLIRSQISFYYATDFHQFITTYYPEICKIPEIINFFEKCFEIQKSYEQIFLQAAMQLGLESLFSLSNNHVPILFKVVKYLPSYKVQKPHYDGTAFSLFLDSTDNQSLLLSPYKRLFFVDDFFSPVRQCLRSDCQNSILLIPGSLLTDFLIFPTPHIVIQSGKTRYATIAFAMRPFYRFSKYELSDLSNLKD